MRDFKDALADLAQIASKHTRAAMLPEDTPGLKEALVKLFDAALRIVGTDMRAATRWVRDQLRQDPATKKIANFIKTSTMEEAARQALAQVEKSGVAQGGLFESPDQATQALQGDLFGAQAAPTLEVPVKVAKINGRAYDMKRDNFEPPAVDTFLDAETIAMANRYVEKYYKDRPPVQISDADRAKAEELLRPLMKLAEDAKPSYDQKIIDIKERTGALGQMSTLTRAESRVAYEWMNMDGADPKAYVSMMQGLPEESVKVLQEVQQMIDKLSREAVALGQLSPDAYERNRMAYLRRSYAKHVLEQDAGEKAKRARVISILGDQYKGRGLTEAAPMAKIQNTAPEWWKRKLAAGRADAGLKGEKFVRLERRAPAGAGTQALPGMTTRPEGKLLEVAYYPAGQTLPAQFKDWDQAGTFEVRDVKGPNLILWRDFTKEERERMGEVDEARFAIAKTLHGMIHDVEVGRYLEWIGHTYAKKEGETIPGTVVEASERYRDTFAPGEWVRVPDSKIPGTQVAKYGKLAGRYIPGPIWNDLRQVVGGQFKPFGDTYAKILTLWKTAKTALSPAVHMNNVMANFVMADWHDVGAAHVAKSLRLILAASQRDGVGVLGRAGNLAARAGIADREAARELLNRYKDAGGDIGSWVTNEISRDQLEPLLASLEKELAATAGASNQAQVGVFSALQHALMLRFPSAWEAFKGGKVGKAIGTEAQALIDLYQAEDDLFRLAAWLKAKEDGKGDLEAGRAARKSFLDYHINAPWIAAMRSTAWPFISFTYRAVPMMLETAAKKPHKLLKLMVIAGGLNALGTMLAGGGDDDERKLLPEEKAGKIWGMVPKLVRMPWNDQHGHPVYLDIRRFIPVGDVFDVGQGHSAVPILPGLQPGGPMALAAEVVVNRSMFTGKPITLDTDTAGQKAAKLGDYLYKAFAPNILGLPGTYATTAVGDATQGKTDAFGRQQSVAQAVASAFGVKLGSYPADVLKLNLNRKAQAELMEIDRNITLLKRQRMTNQIDQAEFEKQAKAEQEKQRRVIEKLREKVQ